MTISFLYNGIAGVYYALMGLGTTETIESLALVLIPPGNVLRSVLEYRKFLWSTLELPGARAWFDFPVLAWLGSPVDDAMMTRIAGDFVHPFEVLAPVRHGDSIYLPFPQAIQGFAAELIPLVIGTDSATDYQVGPFEAGLGCHCASFESGAEPGTAAYSPEMRFPIRSRTCLLSQVSLIRQPGLESGSVWRIISTARVHGIR
jgi:hypothetical protein